MPVKFITTEDTYLDIYHKLVFGWALILGDPDAITAVENSIYTPGTQKNADLEMMMIGRSYLFIGKKTPELRNLLKLDNDKDGWDSLLAILFYPPMPGGLFMAETEHYGKEDREWMLESFVSDLLKEAGVL